MLTLFWTMTGEKAGNVKERLQSQRHLIFPSRRENIVFGTEQRLLGKEPILFSYKDCCFELQCVKVQKLVLVELGWGYSRQCVLSSAVSFFSVLFWKVQHADSIKICVISPTQLVVTENSLCVRYLCVLGMALLL